VDQAEDSKTAGWDSILHALLISLLEFFDELVQDVPGDRWVLVFDQMNEAGDELLFLFKSSLLDFNVITLSEE